MSGALMNQATGTVGPTLEEAEVEVARLLGSIDDAFSRYKWARNQMEIIGQAPELIAHRARVLSDVAGELMQATYHLQRAAHEKATK